MTQMLIKMRKIVLRSKITILFFLIHFALILVIHEMYAFAPDEPGYLYTFNNLYGSSDPNPQFSSGWLNSPKFFLWLLYLPAKCFTFIGLEPSFAVRLYSITLITICFGITHSLLSKVNQQAKVLRYLPFVVFCVPSVFLWTSTGLREVFLISGMFVFWFSLMTIYSKPNKNSWLILFISSYSLFATKNYIWGIVMCAVVVTCLYFIVRKTEVSKNCRILIVGVVTPAVLFGATTSISSFDFLIKSNLTVVGERTGDSVFQASPNAGDDKSQSIANDQELINSLDQKGSKITSEPVTIRGEMTLVLLRNYYKENPNSIFTSLSDWIGVKSKVLDLYQEELNKALRKEDPGLEANGSHILIVGKISEPITVVRGVFNFLFGPIPFVGELGSFASLIALESPIWWALYIAIFFLACMAEKSKVRNREVLLFSTVFFIGFAIFSALVEVNLGTSFRHRSILVVPIVFASLELLKIRKNV